MLRKHFTYSSIQVKLRLYLSIVRSQLSYCPQVWRPNLFKDIVKLERLQHRATTFILNSHLSGYRSQLIYLNLLPISLWLELQDIMFLVKSLKEPSDNFNTLDYVTFAHTHNCNQSIKTRTPILSSI